MAGRAVLGVRMRRLLRTVAPIAIAAAAFSAGQSVPALAQTLNDSLNARTRAAGQSQDRLLVEARELVYDNDKNVVSAVGNVEMYYQGRVLQADRVTYDRNTKRVFAAGNARLTETDGTVATGDRFELTDDFRDGFIDSLRVQQTTTDQGVPITSRFSAPRAERTAGETTVFRRGTYTVCEPCEKDPTRPPLWQVKASRIIHNNAERMIYYEDAQLEIAGVPVAYIPYFSTPDPTVKRKSGFLTPNFIASGPLGFGTSLPYFIALAPNYDLTLTPTFLTRQGVLGEAEWRHRLSNGVYNIRAAGIFQQDQDAFSPAPFGAREKEFRGSVASTGRFYLNERWQYGWDVEAATDKWFVQNYKVRSENLSSTYFKESTSQVFLTGKGQDGFFDLRAYYFRALSYYDWQKQQPVVHPVLDYNKRFRPDNAIGGEVALDVNFTSLTRDAAQFQETPRQTTNLFNFTLPNGAAYNVFETCVVFQRGSCIVRGIGGSTSRLSTQLSWRRTLIDPIGQVWEPFAYARVDGIWTSPNTSRYQNANVLNFIDGDSGFTGRAMPAIGVTYRFPFAAATTDWGTHVFEPIAQVIARPNETRVGRMPNEDAQSLVFDDTNIFAWDRFSGYDRVEGGLRANYGAQYSITGDNGAYTNLMVGQSYHLAGQNSFASPDLANTGLNSGLETRRSDYVGRLHYAPSRQVSFTARGRFAEKDLGLERVELQSNVEFGPLKTSLIYGRYNAQPLLGVDKRREGVLANGAYQITENWSVNASVLVDLDSYLVEREAYFANPAVNPKPGGRFQVSALGLGAQYMDECTTLAVTYTSSYTDAATGLQQRDQSVMVRLELRTLGEAAVTQSLASSGIQDGISP